MVIMRPALLLIALAALACTLTVETPSLTALPSSTPLAPAAETPVLDQPTLTPFPTILPPTRPAPALTLTFTPAPLSIPDQIALVEAERLLITVNRLVSLGNRDVLIAPVPDRGIQAARDLLRREFELIQQSRSDADVFLQTFSFVRNGQTFVADNVVLSLPGTDPAAGVIVIGAHYDTTGKSTAQPGADDNASGVAAVVEIARILAQRPHRATIICALFAAEEEGRYGSLAFVQAVQTQGLGVRAMINLDTIGSPFGLDSALLDDQVRAYSAPPDGSPSRQLALLVQQVAVDYVPELTVMVHSTLDRTGRWGDHQTFSDAGIPAVRLIEPVDDPGRGDTPNDTPDALDPAYLRRVTQLTLAAVLVLADG